MASYVLLSNCTTLPARSAAASPARMRSDLPLPDAPMMVTNGRSVTALSQFLQHTFAPEERTRFCLVERRRAPVRIRARSGWEWSVHAESSGDRGHCLVVGSEHLGGRSDAPPRHVGVTGGVDHDVRLVQAAVADATAMCMIERCGADLSHHSFGRGGGHRAGVAERIERRASCEPRARWASPLAGFSTRPTPP